jgi:hypothetical protein
MNTDGLLSLIFFILELGILIYVIFKNRDHPYFKWIAATLTLLLTYQLAEFIICATEAEIAIRLSHVIITFLPPLGYHFAVKITKWPKKDYLIFYLAAIGFSIHFLFVEGAVIFLDCNFVFADYDTPGVPMLFSIYYSGSMLYSIGFLMNNFRHEDTSGDRGMMKLLLFGYLSFILPMIITLVIDRAYETLVTSVMCKFAFPFAIMLGYMSSKK